LDAELWKTLWFKLSDGAKKGLPKKSISSTGVDEMSKRLALLKKAPESNVYQSWKHNKNITLDPKIHRAYGLEVKREEIRSIWALFPNGVDRSWTGCQRTLRHQRLTE